MLSLAVCLFLRIEIHNKNKNIDKLKFKETLNKSAFSVIYK